MAGKRPEKATQKEHTETEYIDSQRQETGLPPSNQRSSFDTRTFGIVVRG